MFGRRPHRSRWEALLQMRRRSARLCSDSFFSVPSLFSSLSQFFFSAMRCKLAKVVQAQRFEKTKVKREKKRG
jgi:hypothetical protein